MTADAARRFLVKLINDKSIQSQILHLKSASAGLAIAKDLGFDFTANELEEVVRELSEVVARETPERRVPERAADAIVAMVDMDRRAIPRLMYGVPDFWP